MTWMLFRSWRQKHSNEHPSPVWQTCKVDPPPIGALSWDYGTYGAVGHGSYVHCTLQFTKLFFFLFLKRGLAHENNQHSIAQMIINCRQLHHLLLQHTLDIVFARTLSWYQVTSREVLIQCVHLCLHSTRVSSDTVSVFITWSRHKFASMTLLHSTWLLHSTMVLLHSTWLLHSTMVLLNSPWLLHSTMVLLNSPWFLPWLYLILLHPTTALLHSTWMYIILLRLNNSLNSTMTLLDSTSLYFILLDYIYSIMALLHSTMALHDSTTKQT